MLAVEIETVAGVVIIVPDFETKGSRSKLHSNAIGNSYERRSEFLMLYPSSKGARADRNRTRMLKSAKAEEKK